MDSRTGKRKQIYRSGFKTKREALDEMAKLQLQISTGEYTEPEKTVFNEYIESWLFVMQLRQRFINSESKHGRLKRPKNSWKYVSERVN